MPEARVLTSSSLAVTRRPGARIDVVGMPTEQQGVAGAHLIEGERLQLVVDEAEMPAIHVVDHSVEADERRVHDLSHDGRLRAGWAMSSRAAHSHTRYGVRTDGSHREGGRHGAANRRGRIARARPAGGRVVARGSTARRRAVARWR